jgi:hypothetical protein
VLEPGRGEVRIRIHAASLNDGKGAAIRGIIVDIVEMHNAMAQRSVYYRFEAMFRLPATAQYPEWAGHQTSEHIRG